MRTSTALDFLLSTFGLPLTLVIVLFGAYLILEFFALLGYHFGN